MTTASVLAIDLVIAVVAAAGWLGAGAVAAAGPAGRLGAGAASSAGRLGAGAASSAGRLGAGAASSAGRLGAGAAPGTGRRRLTLGLAAVALAATLARVGTTIVLARAGWWFAAEKIVIAAPLALAAVLVVGARLVRPQAVALLFAGYAHTSALLVTVLHGYPVSLGVALLAVAGVGLATVVTWRFLGPRPSRAVSRSAVVVAVAALVTGTGLAATTSAAPGVPHAHHHGDVLTVGEPTKRFTLTAGTAVVSAGGRDVAAWAFNGQVPGPQLTASVGDILQITLRNHDISRGVTLHWHGYDVPNSQDGVPGVTQDAVLPGQEFVYRFRADQAGTFWYHTHSASDVGVRMGLYGVLVVHPAPPAGVDVTVPVHTLAGHPLPAATQEPVDAGKPVRLRLINTDSTTHRYALAGTPFRVVAIDGVDLREPPPLTETAVRIPAGGRYDLAFTAPATPVALFVDGRAAWSTGPVSADTGGWPTLDPLTYGAAAPAPWTRYDQKLTLVLDRGLDLHGWLPRYAHTVNGAADPDIPAQVVRPGQIVKFTIVNRSLEVHPWHLHGHHVLVLSRDGKPATGSPLWLDSFDVRPGEVWEVAFRADNPGMWANHCHNLPHADQGMTMHLTYA